MSNLICPISDESINKRAARLGAVLTAGLLAAYAITSVEWILVALVADYSVRVLTPYRPPLGWVAAGFLRAARIPPQTMNKGPKVFAWRVGFIMAVLALALFPLSLPASVVVAVILAGFNLLDGVGNLCVGCVIYTYIVLPRLGPARARA